MTLVAFRRWAMAVPRTAATGLRRLEWHGGRLKRSSLKLRLLAAAALSIAAALAVAGYGLSRIFEAHVERRVEHELDNHLRQLASLIEATPDGRLVVTSALPDPRFELPLSGLYWQIEEDGKILDTSNSLGEETLALPRQLASDANPSCVTAIGPGGKRIELVVRALTIKVGDRDRHLRLAAALNESEIGEAVAEFRRALLASLLVLAGLLVTAAWVQVSVGLMPLEALRARLASVRAGAELRLPSDLPSEVLPLADDLNSVLAMQEQSIARARARAADLAHGLKTPLTVLNSIARELAARSDPATAADLTAQVAIMQRHIERELARARLGVVHAVRRAGIEKVVLQVVSALSRLPQGGALRWQVDVPTSMQLAIDADDLAEVVGNLLENCANHAHAQVRVTAVALSGRPEAAAAGTSRPLVAISIEDDGRGVPADLHEAVLERGVRLDDSHRGTGLGLSIAKEIVEAYGGKLELYDSPLGGLGVRIVAPGGMAAMPAPARLPAVLREAAE